LIRIQGFSLRSRLQAGAFFVQTRHFLFFDIGVEFFIPVLVARVFHRVGGFVKGRKEVFGGVEKQERISSKNTMLGRGNLP
jgi:hypothetical protein